MKNHAARNVGERNGCLRCLLFHESLLNLAQVNHQLIQLLLIYEARSTEHHIATLVVLRECDAVADAVQASEQAHEAIQTVCQTAVRWRTELEGVHQEAELELCLFWGEA